MMSSAAGSSSSSESRPSLLLVDDDVELCRLMRLYLNRAGYQLTCSVDGRDGVAQALSGAYDLMLLDVTLPLLDGFEVLRQTRRSSGIPTIMLTSRSLSADRLNGFDKGADDYLCKPFEPEELVARIRAVLRRSQAPKQEVGWQSFGAIRISEASRQVLSANAAVDLTTVEFDLLLMLSRAGGRVVKRDALTIAIQERKPSFFDRSLDVHISHLRAKLGPAGAGIQTVRGVGYLLATGDPAAIRPAATEEYVR
jgi:DNA-binding response OmpR family regulator